MVFHYETSFTTPLPVMIFWTNRHSTGKEFESILTRFLSLPSGPGALLLSSEIYAAPLIDLILSIRTVPFDNFAELNI